LNTFAVDKTVLGAFANLWKATTTFVIYDSLSTWNNSDPTGWILMKFDIWGFFENQSRKYNFH
jgi:hypothetical protein